MKKSCIKGKRALSVRAALCALLAALMLAAAVGCSVKTEPVVGTDAQEEEELSSVEQTGDYRNRLSFETTDINGGKVTSEEVFGAHKVTMLNIWTSWCGYCIMEMPELEQMNSELAQKDCAVVGLLLDAYEDSGLEDGRQAVADTGVTYTVLLPWDGCDSDLPVQAFPTTVFIDSEGNIIDVGAVVGADIEAYRETIDKALEKVG